MPFKVEITVYNSAGEAVDHLFDGASQNLPGGFTLSSNLVAPNGPPLVIQLGGLLANGQKSLAWTGVNDAQQFVSGGLYTIQIHQIDPFGSVQTWAQEVSVLPPVSQTSLAVYNSAGELVARLDTSSVMPLSSTAQITGVGFADPSKTSFGVPSQAGGPGGVVFELKLSDGSVQSLSWNGRNSLGQEVSSGSYTVQLISQVVGSESILDAKTFVILAAQAAAPTLQAGPNPAGPKDKNLVFTYSALAADERASVRLYNLAGELVAQGLGPSGGGVGKITLTIGHWSSGVYMAVFEVHEGGGLKSRQVKRIAVIR
jgi:hypothetical protein